LTPLIWSSRGGQDGWIGEKLNETGYITRKACEIITRFARKVNLPYHTMPHIEFQRRLHYIVEK
jgi:hypothetical protein